jgi:hypothetical protein
MSIATEADEKMKQNLKNENANNNNVRGIKGKVISRKVKLCFLVWLFGGSKI